MRLANLIPLALSCVAMCATAQPTNSLTTRSLSLPDSIDLALKHNLDLQIERATTDMARFGWEGAYGAFDPNFFLEATHRYDDVPLYFVRDKANPDFAYKAQSEIFGTGLKGKLPQSGLGYELRANAVDFHNVRTDFNLTPEEQQRFLGTGTNETFTQFPNGVRTGHETYLDAGVTLRQPLLKDSWIDLERHTIKINKNHLQMSEVALRGAIMQTITAVQLAYYDLIFARENVEVQKKALQLARQFLTETAARVRVGELTQLEQKNAEAHVETVQADVFAAEQIFVEQQNILKQYLTDDFNSWRDIEIIPTDGLVAVPDTHDRIQSWENALTKRTDILLAKLELERQQIILKYNYNQMFPSWDIVGSVGARAADPSFGHAIGDLGEGPYYSIGTIFSIPFGNRTARKTYQATQAAQKQAILRMRKLEQTVLVQVDTASKVMESAYKRVGATRNRRQYSEAALEAEQKKFLQNVATGFLVLEAQRNVTTARSSEMRALADYNKARAQLTFSEGVTLERNSIRLETK